MTAFGEGGETVTGLIRTGTEYDANSRFIRPKPSEGLD